MQDARKGQLGAARTHDTRGAAAGKESSSAMSVTVGVDERERGSIGNRRWPLPSLDLDGSDGKGRGGDDHDPVVATSVSGKCAGGESGSMASYRSAVARLLPAASLCLPDVREIRERDKRGAQGAIPRRPLYLERRLGSA